MDAYKCDRCGKYYDNSTTATGPTLCKSSKTRILDLCESCKKSLAEWLESFNREENKKHIESFIKLKSFTSKRNNAGYMLVPDFLEALRMFFDYKGNGEVDDFINDATTRFSPFSDMIGIQEIKSCLNKYFKHEWKDEFYE